MRNLARLVTALSLSLTAYAAFALPSAHAAAPSAVVVAASPAHGPVTGPRDSFCDGA